MGKYLKKKMVILSCLVLAVLFLYMFAIRSERPCEVRIVKAGRASLSVPVYFPREKVRGTAVSGAVIIGEMDEREICYEQYVGIFWSDRPIPEAALVPTQAYRRIAETAARPDIVKEGTPLPAQELIHLWAEKPCGKIVDTDLAIIRTSCPKTGKHYAVAGLLDPLVTVQQLGKIAGSLECE